MHKDGGWGAIVVETFSPSRTPRTVERHGRGIPPWEATRLGSVAVAANDAHIWTIALMVEASDVASSNLLFKVAMSRTPQHASERRKSPMQCSRQVQHGSRACTVREVVQVAGCAICRTIFVRCHFISVQLPSSHITCSCCADFMAQRTEASHLAQRPAAPRR